MTDYDYLGRSLGSLELIMYYDLNVIQLKNYCLAKVSFLQDKNKTTQSRYNIRVQNQFCYKRQKQQKKKKTRTKKKRKHTKTKEKLYNKDYIQRVQTNKKTSVNMDSRE